MKEYNYSLKEGRLVSDQDPKKRTIEQAKRDIGIGLKNGHILSLMVRTKDS